MKLTNPVKLMAMAAAFVLTLTAAGTARASVRGCSAETLKGAYIDQDTGTILGLGPFAGVNIDKFDGRGGLTISGYSSVAGTASPGVETGTYQVNADCTGTYTVSGGGLTVHGYFVISVAKHEVDIVIIDPGVVINCVAKRQYPDDDN